MSLKQENAVTGFFVFENKAKLCSEVDIARRGQSANNRKGDNSFKQWVFKGPEQ